jgi:hypothetical protein
MSIRIHWKMNGGFGTHSIKTKCFSLYQVQLVMNEYTELNLYSLIFSFDEDVCFKRVDYNKNSFSRQSCFNFIYRASG